MDALPHCPDAGFQEPTAATGLRDTHDRRVIIQILIGTVVLMWMAFVAGSISRDIFPLGSCVALPQIMGARP